MGKRLPLALPEPLRDYAGRCCDAVDALLASGVPGVRRDGVWLGEARLWGSGKVRGRIYPWRWRRDAAGRTYHVWLERPDGTVVDPTRWAMEGKWPYIYEGPADLYGEAVLPLETWDETGRVDWDA